MSRIVIWSGGYDSTLLLHRELQDHKEATAWSFIMPGISQHKLHSEHVVRERYKKYMQETLSKFKLSHQVINIGYDNFNNIPEGCFSQQTFWTLFSAWFAPKDSTIIFGFHKGDDFWRMHEKVDWMRTYIEQIMEKKITFEYPLQCTPKWQIVHDIKNYGLEENVWTCENPPIPMSECGECTTCTILRQAKSEIEYRLKNNLLSEPEPVKAEEKMTVDAADVIVDPASEKK